MLGVVVSVIGIVAGYLVGTSIDLSTMPAGNDFIAAMLRSEVISSSLTRAQVTAGSIIAGVAVCLGIIMFGIGIIVDRIEKLSRGANA